MCIVGRTGLRWMGRRIAVGNADEQSRSPEVEKLRVRGQEVISSTSSTLLDFSTFAQHMEFVCKLGTETGKVLVQTEQAASEADLRHRLKNEGFYVFSVRSKDFLAGRWAPRRKGRIKPDDFLVFNQQFLTLSKSGLPLQKSLELLAGQVQSEALRAAIIKVQEKVRAGSLLSEAFESAGQFPKMYSATLRAGERSGSLDRVLAQYLAYQKTSRSFRKKFLSALIYPAFLMTFLVGLISFVVTFVVPRFANLYAELEVQLPPLTLFFISFSLAVKRYALLILVGDRGGGDVDARSAAFPAGTPGVGTGEVRDAQAR